ncbi:MAG: hypothetical protein ACRDF4_11840, partial [Rhabdochlamydiaceae bacterium]
ENTYYAAINSAAISFLGVINRAGSAVSRSCHEITGIQITANNSMIFMNSATVQGNGTTVIVNNFVFSQHIIVTMYIVISL